MCDAQFLTIALCLHSRNTAAVIPTQLATHLLLVQVHNGTAAGQRQAQRFRLSMHAATALGLAQQSLDSGAEGRAYAMGKRTGNAPSHSAAQPPRCCQIGVVAVGYRREAGGGAGDSLFVGASVCPDGGPDNNNYDMRRCNVSPGLSGDAAV